MKQSKGSKQIKSLNLYNLDGVRDVTLGHTATADRPPGNYAKSAYTPGHDTMSSFADVYARRKRWGLV